MSRIDFLRSLLDLLQQMEKVKGDLLHLTSPDRGDVRDPLLAEALEELSHHLQSLLNTVANAKRRVE